MSRKASGSNKGKKKYQSGQVPLIMDFEPRGGAADGFALDSDVSGFGGIMPDVTPEMEGLMSAMAFLAEGGITPREYELFYNIFAAAKHLTGDEVFEGADDDGFLPEIREDWSLRRSSTTVVEYEPLPDAADRTLVLKIQMKNVKKPPMWREVEVPASFDFMRLHEVIQAVVGLEDCHLWQFNAKAYDDSLLIACDMDTDFSTEPTHEAEETYLTQFLQKNGDKLEYVYDFGDDWIFTVEVKEVLDKSCESPVCRKYKSDLNAIEDFGGVESYIEARRDMEEWAKLSKKEQRKRAEQRGFDTPDEYIDYLDSNQFDLDMVNDDLSMILPNK